MIPTVYVLQHGEKIKVGHTSQPQKRLYSLRQLLAVDELPVLALCEFTRLRDAQDFERETLSEFSRHECRPPVGSGHEWFSLPTLAPVRERLGFRAPRFGATVHVGWAYAPAWAEMGQRAWLDLPLTLVGGELSDWGREALHLALGAPRPHRTALRFDLAWSQAKAGRRG